MAADVVPLRAETDNYLNTASCRVILFFSLHRVARPVPGNHLSRPDYQVKPSYHGWATYSKDGHLVRRRQQAPRPQNG